MEKWLRESRRLQFHERLMHAFVLAWIPMDSDYPNVKVSLFPLLKGFDTSVR